ncbi:MAG: DNA-directed RNA polymerase subunit beta [Spirochaetes bacterium]|nr:DNA-directed RNA polymerase subunit beta [Spirochaetota bacterium]
MKNKLPKKVIFGKKEKIMDLPDLIEVQINSYEWFLQKEIPTSQRIIQGLEEVFHTIFPVENSDRTVVIEYVESFIDQPKYSEIESRHLGKSYASPLRAKFRIIYKKTGEVREQEVYLGDLPLMTTRGTFIINGAERVVVNQIHRSPGVFFGLDANTGALSARLIPAKGPWVEFEFDAKGFLIVRIDRKRKIWLGTFFKALGFGSLPVLKIKEVNENPLSVTVSATEEVANKIPVWSKIIFSSSETAFEDEQKSETFFIVKKDIQVQKKDKAIVILFLGKSPYQTIKKRDDIKYDLKDLKYIKFSYKKKEFISEQKFVLRTVPLYNLNQVILRLFHPVKKVDVHKEKLNRSEVVNNLLGMHTGAPIYDKGGKEIILDVGEKITADVIEQIIYEKIPHIFIMDTTRYHDELALVKSMVRDISKDPIEAIDSIMSIIRPGEIVNPETAEDDFRSLFFVDGNYDFSDVGRFKVNKKFRYDPYVETRTLIEYDIINTIDYLMRIYIQEEEADDIDHLANRRVRSVGELLTSQMKVAFARMEKIIKERFTVLSPESYTPQNLISIKPITSIINEFFGTSQLSQFMDQTNPLAELTHKRRLNALGPGGLTRERASYEVRDVHYTHYGRICPIETPEGPNIGLIVSLATYAKLNKYGFISTPYRKVENGVVTNKIDYLTAAEEEHYRVAQANAKIDEKGRFIESVVSARYKNNFLFIRAKEVDYMDLNPVQIFSVSTALIPFLEHDDANRALMGSNMQRQAVPLLITEQPLIKTGMEKDAARNSGVLVFAKRDGEVIDVTSDKIVIKPAASRKKDDLDIYILEKFRRTNQGTCYNQRPLVQVKQKIKQEQVIADGPSTAFGELALGKNILVAFMPWEGYNFEDAILLSEKLLKEDSFTSTHIEEFEAVARDTKLGKEIITRDIPNLSEEALSNLDENGIIRIGAEVKPGDILVGKVTPKGESELTPEYKLLHSIFGEKAREVRDTSLRIPHGVEGVIIDVKVFSREEGFELEPGVEKFVKVYVASKKKLQVGDKLAGRHGNKGVLARILPEEDMPYLPDGTPVEMVLNPLGVPSRMNIGQVFETQLGWAAKELDVQFITPVFQGPKVDDVDKIMKEASLPSFGKTEIYDGRSGNLFKSKVTVGYLYMMKLSHLVDDKIHARSTGPYSLVTQQPLGGKAQFGGQRFGEMEVWALEAYGASNTLQELLTVKSDDMLGRAKVYESIIKGKNPSAPGIPESFNVLVQETRGLCLDMSVYNSRGQQLNLYEGSTTDWRKLKKPTFEDLWKK